MNTETMITELNAVAEKHRNDKRFTFDTSITAMCEDVIPKLEQLAEYGKIGTVEECREARERQRGKKFTISHYGDTKDRGIAFCPNCGMDIHRRGMIRHCFRCGQVIDWSE